MTHGVGIIMSVFAFEVVLIDLPVRHVLELKTNQGGDLIMMKIGLE